MISTLLHSKSRHSTNEISSARQTVTKKHSDTRSPPSMITIETFVSIVTNCNSSWSSAFSAAAPALSLLIADMVVEITGRKMAQQRKTDQWCSLMYMSKLIETALSTMNKEPLFKEYQSATSKSMPYLKKRNIPTYRLQCPNQQPFLIRNIGLEISLRKDTSERNKNAGS